MVLKTQPFAVNIGPQHPSTHGVFRLRVALDGEVVQDLEPIFGYLHRGVEKLAEERTYIQFITTTDRMDYMAAMSNELGYVLAIEKLAGIKVPERAEYIRIIMAELQRLNSHFMGVGALLNDCGCAATPLLYMFREREKLLDLFEMACGQRMTCNYMRPGGVAQDLPPEFMPAARKFIDEMPGYIDEYEQLFMGNEIVLARLKEVGILPADLAISYSISGPVLRASGVKWDLRRADPYSIYDRFEFDVPVGKTGDCYDRMWVRMQEMRQCVRILKQAMKDLPKGEFRAKGVPFLLRPPAGEVYSRIEAPKGELGYHLVSDNTIAPYRLHVRAPAFINLGALREMIVGWKMADLVVILGSIDICMGEVDR
ncbi:MAG: NADH-quinone oxidoreductase subunit D [Chloroflexi bacterium]|nr:NADH-quinone oxidoreductase subunit D [Chloroflexota bacterium]